MNYDDQLTDKEFQNLISGMSYVERLALYNKLKLEAEQDLQENQSKEVQLLNKTFDNISECLTEIKNIFGL